MSARAEPLRDDPIVPVSTWLRPSTFRQLTGHAANRRMTVGQLLSKLADDSLKPLEPPVPVRKRRRSLTSDEISEAQYMRDQGHPLTNIAARFDISVASASRHTTGALR